jgi:hypothetical protein
MPVSRKESNASYKHCPVCKEEVSMSVIRKADGDDDLYWILCIACESSFALTRQAYQKEKQPDISAADKNSAKTYCTDRKYKIGELIYHPKWDDLGWVTNKATIPIANCSGSIVVSFMEGGLKTLIEGYTAT